MRHIITYDTTLRDGSQCEDLTLTLEDKLKIARKLDELGVDYIEGGWPGANPVDNAFFKEIKNYEFSHAKISAFGSTHHASHTAETDPSLKTLLDSGAQTLTIFGKSCSRHAQEALHLSPERNLQIVQDSVAYLASQGRDVFFDAEHFFDAYKHDNTYSFSILKAAHDAGAKTLVLCDTNGGSLPSEIFTIVQTIRLAMPKVIIGMHAHNDCEMAVANSLVAIEAGACHVQGTINGVGERCGNTNLCSLIPTLELKKEGRYNCLPNGKLKSLQSIANYIAEVCNLAPFGRQPFIGKSAFAHKGGIHVSAVNRNSSLYEHIDPELVGNRQRILVTDLAGRSNIISLAKRFGFHLDKDEPVVKGLLNELKAKAALGYDYAAAEASVELLLLRKLGRCGVRDFFQLKQFRVMQQREQESPLPQAEATVTLMVEGVEEHTAAFGFGPVNALDNALRKALATFYPRLQEMRLLDFKVRVLTGKKNNTCTTDSENTGTASNVRVLIESGDKTHKWTTVGVSHDIIEASWQALVDSMCYKLYKDENEQRNKDRS